MEILKDFLGHYIILKMLAISLYNPVHGLKAKVSQEASVFNLSSLILHSYTACTPFNSSSTYATVFACSLTGTGMI